MAAEVGSMLGILCGTCCGATLVDCILVKVGVIRIIAHIDDTPRIITGNTRMFLAGVSVGSIAGGVEGARLGGALGAEVDNHVIRA